MLSLFPSLLSLFPSVFPSFCHFFPSFCQFFPSFSLRRCCAGAVTTPVQEDQLTECENYEFCITREIVFQNFTKKREKLCIKTRNFVFKMMNFAENWAGLGSRLRTLVDMRRQVRFCHVFDHFVTFSITFSIILSLFSITFSIILSLFSPSFPLRRLSPTSGRSRSVCIYIYIYIYISISISTES